MEKGRSNRTICRSHGIEADELVTAFGVNKCRLQGVFNPSAMGSQDEVVSQMAAQPASGPSIHLNVIVDTRIRVNFSIFYLLNFIVYIYIYIFSKFFYGLRDNLIIIIIIIFLSFIYIYIYIFKVINI